MNGGNKTDKPEKADVGNFPEISRPSKPDASICIPNYCD